jgi:hypothetical protein
LQKRLNRLSLFCASILALTVFISLNAATVQASDTLPTAEDMRTENKVASTSVNLWVKATTGPGPMASTFSTQFFLGGQGTSALYRANNCVSIVGGPKAWGYSETKVSNTILNDPDVRGDFRRNNVSLASRGNSREHIFDTASWTSSTTCNLQATFEQKSWHTIWAGGTQTVNDVPTSVVAYIE